MYWSPARKLAYIRIPKTGSTTAYVTLTKAIPDFAVNGDVHETYTMMRERSDLRVPGVDRHNAFPEMRPGAVVVAFVRHPLAWLPSFFAFLKSGGKYANTWGAHTEQMDPTDGTAFLDVLKVTPYDWFTHDGEVMATEIWRTEDMASFCATWQKPWQHVNKTAPRRAVQLEWTADDLERIKIMFARELKHYPEGL